MKHLEDKRSTHHPRNTLSDTEGFRSPECEDFSKSVPQDCADRLWSDTCERMDAGRLVGARVLFVGFPRDLLSSLREDVRALGVRVTAASPSVVQLPNVAGMGRAFSHVIVYFDGFEDVECGVEALAAFRISAPAIIVIACSSRVGGDDLGSERAAICDATLRLPVSQSRLRDALVAATSNHEDRRIV